MISKSNIVSSRAKAVSGSDVQYDWESRNEEPDSTIPPSLALDIVSLEDNEQRTPRHEPKTIVLAVSPAAVLGRPLEIRLQARKKMVSPHQSLRRRWPYPHTMPRLVVDHYRQALVPSIGPYTH